MGYYLEEHPNTVLAQYGWPRTRVSGVIGVHTTESGVYFSGGDPGAENTAAFISTRNTHGSYHIMADWDTIVPLVRPTFAAWADTTNNAHALSVSGAMNAARWRDLSPERAAQIVRNMGIAAAMLVRDAIAHGALDTPVPARRITAAEAIAGSRAGFYGHGETNPGTRYDPGTNFDWDLFLASYAAAVGGSINYQSTTSEEDSMAIIFDSREEFIAAVAEAVDPAHKVTRANVIKTLTENTEAQHAETRTQVINVGQAQEDVTRGWLADQIKASSPEQIAELVPDEMAQKVVDAITARLQRGAL